MIRRFINKVLGRKSRALVPAHRFCRWPKHGIRRDQLDDCALKTCETLAQAGFKGYVVGGAVRDLLLGLTPKDFDVATDARRNRSASCFAAHASSAAVSRSCM